MKLWIRKTFVILVAIMTLVTNVPPVSPNAEATEHKDISTNANSNENDNHTTVAELEESPESSLNDRSEHSENDYLNSLLNRAQEQTMTKFGPKIAAKIEEEFTENILPVMEEVIATVINEAGEDTVPYYAITEKPTSGLGERIFHVYDEQNKKDVAKFHVRRERRPQEGYWFNFHYHISKDNFEEHYEIGEIYWDKNMPPKWMT